MPEGTRPGVPVPPAVDVSGYPAELEHEARLQDGRTVFIRPVRPSDEAELHRALATADPATLSARFLGSPPHDAASLRRLVEVDYVHRLALVAFAPDGTGVGVARYEGQPGSDSAEVAVAVDPGWRREGLGAMLLRELGVAAMSRGIHRFTALVRSDNAAALAVQRASGLDFTVEIDQGTSEIVMWLDGRPPQQPEDTPPPTPRPGLKLGS